MDVYIGNIHILIELKNTITKEMVKSLKDGDYIKAIRLYKNRNKASLAESKTRIDDYMQRHGIKKKVREPWME